MEADSQASPASTRSTGAWPRKQAAGRRSDHLARLLAGVQVFRQACAMGLGGIVSKRLTATKSGPSRDWIKVKNPDCPAMIRARIISRGWDNDARRLPPP
jgi:hypothetical protein